MTDQDPQRATQELVSEGARPLTEEERKAADRDPGVVERVYAPASERVPRTVEGHRDVIEHTDSGTPERQAMGEASSSPVGTSNAEPSFTRVPRPSNGPGEDNGDYSHDVGWSPQGNRWMSNMSGGSAVPLGISWLTLGVCGGVGIWLWMRWQRERNRPINRLRRQARQTATLARDRAYTLYEQMPDLPDFPDEARRPAVGLGTALLSLAVVLWRMSQRRSQAEDARARADKASSKVRRRADKASRQASDIGKQAMADLDWQERVMLLRELWRERAPSAR
jgi:hypothetical protein